jgi:hypothetical protein
MVVNAMSDWRWYQSKEGTLYPINPIKENGGIIRGNRECSFRPPDDDRFWGVRTKTLEKLSLQAGDTWTCNECGAEYKLAYDPGGDD